LHGPRSVFDPTRYGKLKAIASNLLSSLGLRPARLLRQLVSVITVGEKTSEIIQAAMKNGRVNLLETEAKAICADYRMPIPPFELAKSAEQASSVAQKLGYPIVLKIVSQDILHKTEAGGVLLGIQNPVDVRNGFSRIVDNARRYNSNAKLEGVLVQRMAPPGREIIIGGLVDPQFGQTLMFGLGGVFVEILRDVTLRIAPIVKQDAQEMIREIKAYPILKGFRGQPPADEDAIVDILLSASDLVMENQDINQMDLNPVMIYDKGASIVDARMILQRR